VALKIQAEDIPRILDTPIKNFGKWFDATLKDKEAINQLQVSLSQHLKNIDNPGVQGVDLPTLATTNVQLTIDAV
jgi:hypothetical protein